METGNETKNEVSGSGALAQSHGVAAGQDGVAIGGNLIGNVIKAANIFYIIGGVEGISKDNLRELGREIEASSPSGLGDSTKILDLLSQPVQEKIGRKSADYIIQYLQIVGQTLEPIVVKYTGIIEKRVFPFGNFLQDLIATIGRSCFVDDFYKGFGFEEEVINCQDVGVLIANRSRIISLNLPEATRIMTSHFKTKLPHDVPILLCHRSGEWTGEETFLAQLYNQGNNRIVCPISFNDREMFAHRWNIKIDQDFFSALSSGIIADFMLYLHRLNVEKDTIRNLISAMDKVRSKKADGFSESLKGDSHDE